MSTSSSRARFLRGGLVGMCSALVTALAHAIGGGEAPAGSTFVELVIACATVGAAVGALDVSGRRSRAGLVIAALCTGQALGHVTLTVASCHHHADMAPSSPLQMLALHAVAAVVLGLLIGTVEYLFGVCSSVVSWLRLFATDVCVPPVALVHRYSNVVVVQSVLLRAGLGTRAPPALSALGA